MAKTTWTDRERRVAGEMFGRITPTKPRDADVEQTEETIRAELSKLETEINIHTRALETTQNCLRAARLRQEELTARLTE